MNFDRFDCDGFLMSDHIKIEDGENSITIPSDDLSLPTLKGERIRIGRSDIVVGTWDYETIFSYLTSDEAKRKFLCAFGPHLN